MEIPRLSAKERLILELLINSPRQELYGLEMVNASSGELKRGTVYVTLERMAEKGYVTSREVKEPGQPGLPRRVFQVTGLGSRVHRAWEAARAEWAGAFA
jgi:DNA-binding PadR family transcriptional regulator